MRIGEVARRSGVSVRALRYYEEQGILSSKRGPGGQRDFDESAVERVRVFQQFYAAGLSSRRIAELLPCIDTGTTSAEQRAMLEHERGRIVEQMGALGAALTRLDGLIAAAADRSA